MIKKQYRLQFRFTALCAVLVGTYSPPGGGESYVHEPQQTSAQFMVVADTSQDKAKDAGRVCFAALKAQPKHAALLFEGADILKRHGDVYFLRIRTLKNDSLGSYLRTTYVCEAVQRKATWSVVKIDLPR